MKSLVFSMLIALTAVLAFGSAAEASLSLFLDDGTTSFTVMDGGVGDIDGSVDGNITFDNMVATKILPGFGTLRINSFSNAPGTGVFAGLNTTTLELTSTSAKMIDVFVSDVFSLPGTAGDLLAVSNSLTGNHLSGGTASASQISLVDGSPTPTASVSVSSPIPATDVTYASLLRAGATFTLETQLTTTLPAGTNASFTSITRAVIPEPATIAVWSALGVIGLLAYRRRMVA